MHQNSDRSYSIDTYHRFCRDSLVFYLEETEEYQVFAQSMAYRKDPKSWLISINDRPWKGIDNVSLEDIL